MLRSHKRFPSLVPVALMLALSGCGTVEETRLAESEGERSVCDHQWLLESLSVDGREHRSRLLWKKFWRDRPYLTCDDLGYVRGSAGSNPYLGRFSLSDSGAISWPQVPAVSRMSDVRDSSELEKDYLKALPQTESLKVEGDSLIMRSESGKTRLEFRRVAEMPRK
ncbi:Heat shock protein HslJ [Microbulbifer donghaiensis]|uniref:Heat shock protein HslJ n=1 Tax=Microbulbifer donghaiensis TaxID=494016 RepID=A0A1M4ZV13_9GAMM|nr:META domain-containing protein [Microbulbifer donghaiensis]SHF21920.1 Heat shock protein HslJ [Microbulbifer donghaiensis]